MTVSPEMHTHVRVQMVSLDKQSLLKNKGLIINPYFKFNKNLNLL